MQHLYPTSTLTTATAESTRFTGSLLLSWRTPEVGAV